jgi:hypothetical protein
MKTYSPLIVLGSLLIAMGLALSSAAQQPETPGPGMPTDSLFGSGNPAIGTPSSGLMPGESGTGPNISSPGGSDFSSGPSDVRSIIEPGPVTSPSRSQPSLSSGGGFRSEGVRPDFGAGASGTTGAAR